VRTLERILPAMALALLLGGCGPYALQGRIVRGDVSYVTVVDKDDPRLAGPGVEGVQVDLVVDPGDLSKTRMAPEFSGAEGDIRLPVRKPGARILKYEVGVTARREGFRSAYGVFDLPMGSRRLLVVLAPGRDAPADSGAERTIEDDLRDFGVDR